MRIPHTHLRCVNKKLYCASNCVPCKHRTIHLPRRGADHPPLLLTASYLQPHGPMHHHRFLYNSRCLCARSATLRTVRAFGGGRAHLSGARSHLSSSEPRAASEGKDTQKFSAPERLHRAALQADGPWRAHSGFCLPPCLRAWTKRKDADPSTTCGISPPAPPRDPRLTFFLLLFSLSRRFGKFISLVRPSPALSPWQLRQSAVRSFCALSSRCSRCPADTCPCQTATRCARCSTLCTRAPSGSQRTQCQVNASRLNVSAPFTHRAGDGISRLPGVLCLRMTIFTTHRKKLLKLIRFQRSISHRCTSLRLFLFSVSPPLTSQISEVRKQPTHTHTH